MFGVYIEQEEEIGLGGGGVNAHEEGK